MRRILVLAPVAVLLIVAALWSDDEEPKGKYRKPAPAKTLARWKRDFREKRPLVPPLPEPRASDAPALDFSGTYRFGRYDYDLIIEQHGDQVTFRSGGVDHQDIGGAFDTIGMRVVRGGTIHARWWCFDLSRNYGNNGGAEMWFHDGDLDKLRVRYYHDADEKIEEGYGVRLGKHESEKLHYRIRIPHPVKEFDPPLVLQGTVTGRAGELWYARVLPPPVGPDAGGGRARLRQRGRGHPPARASRRALRPAAVELVRRPALRVHRSDAQQEERDLELRQLPPQLLRRVEGVAPLADRAQRRDPRGLRARLPSRARQRRRERRRGAVRGVPRAAGRARRPHGPA